MKQYRGCSKLVYAIVNENESGTTYGEVKTLAPVKNVNVDLTSEKEDVYADNTLQQTTYGASTRVRTFDCTRIAPEVVAELLGHTTIAVGGTNAYATDPNGSNRPYIAVGYALHDGDVDRPCELVWCFKGKVNSISQTSATIDNGTTSEGQSVEIEFVAPKDKFTTTNKRNLDVAISFNEEATFEVEDWFKQVITPDNIATILNA